MVFKIRTLYPDELTENIFGTILVLLALKSFEYVLKRLLLSSGKAKISLGKYALGLAFDQAFNPLNYINWYRANPDFASGQSVDVNTRASRRIQLDRGTLAISLAFLTLLAEAGFFFAALPTTKSLTISQLTLQVRQTNVSTDYVLQRRTCAAMPVQTKRATLTAVFAFCNEEIGDVGDQGGNFTAFINQTEYSLGTAVSRNFENGNSQKEESETLFTLLRPAEPNSPTPKNLVVSVDPTVYLQFSGAAALHSYYKQLGCDVDINKPIGNLSLPGCTKAPRASEMLERILKHVEVLENAKATKIGFPNRGIRIIGPANNNIVVGQIQLQRSSAVGILVVALFLLVSACILHQIVSDDSSEVIAALLRERADLDFDTPAVSMQNAILEIQGNQVKKLP